MSEEPKTTNEEPRPSADDSWQEVGRQFQTLGESLAQAFRATKNNVASRQQVQEVRDGLQAMVREVSQAIDEGIKTPEAHHVKDEAVKAAEKLVSAGEQTVQDARPLLINALHDVNNELQKLIEKMEGK